MYLPVTPVSYTLSRIFEVNRKPQFQNYRHDTAETCQSLTSIGMNSHWKYPETNTFRLSHAGRQCLPQPVNLQLEPRTLATWRDGNETIRKSIHSPRYARDSVQSAGLCGGWKIHHLRIVETATRPGPAMDRHSKHCIP